MMDQSSKKTSEELAELHNQLEGLRKEIGELKEQNEKVSSELVLFHTLFDNTPDSIYFKDRDGRFTWVNRAQLKILGLDSLADAIGKSDFDFFSSEHAKEARDDELRIMETGGHVVGKEEEDLLHNGVQRWFFSTKIPWVDASGRVVGTCGISRDITSRKLMQRELNEERNLLRTLVDNLPDFIYVKDRNHKYLLNNLAHVKMLGKHSAAEVVGMSSFDFFPSDLAKKYFADEEQLLTSGTALVNREEPVVGHDNKRMWVSTTKMPLKDSDGNITGLVCMSRDITEKKEAEEALQKAKDELEIRVQERTAALVQEIAQHLKVQKALKESERKLQEANTRLGKRVTQLNYLNATANHLARFTHRSDLLPAIVNAFVQRFPGVEAGLCEQLDNEFVCVSQSPGLDTNASRQFCERLVMHFHSTGTLGTLLVTERAQHVELKDFHEESVSHLPVYLLLPLYLESRLIAVIEIFGPVEFLEFYEEEQTVLNTLAVQSAISLSNANYLKELGDKVRLQGELEVAQRIQRRFTPQNKPSIPRIDLKGVYHPAYEVGGDYLDYFQTDAGHWVIFIADVSGKGIPAALVMTMLRSTVRAKARYEFSAKNLLVAVNDMMAEDLDDKSFVTALCLIVDKNGSSMSYARAGHPPMLFALGAQVGEPSQLKPKGIALGMVEGPLFSEMLEEVILPLSDGDRFLIYTDGLVEARDPRRKTYGLSRLLQLIANNGETHPDDVLDSILRDVKSFTQSAPYQDDLTILAMEVAGPLQAPFQGQKETVASSS